MISAPRQKLDSYHHKLFLRREIQIHSDLEHPNVLKLFTAFYEEELESIVLVLEYCSGGDLFEYIHKTQKQKLILPEWKIKFLVR